MVTLRATALRSTALLRGSALAVLVPLITATASGCYNTYQVPSDEFRKLQSAAAVSEDSKLDSKINGAATQEERDRLKEERDKLLDRAESTAVVVKSVNDKDVSVTTNSKLFVRSQGGRRYQITPFNFSMASSQLVASDRDTLQPLADLKSFEVDQLSNGKTIAVVSLGIAAAAGLIVAIVATAGAESQAEE